MAQQRTLTLTLTEEEWQLLVAERNAVRGALATWSDDPFVLSPANVAQLVLVEQLREHADRRAAHEQVAVAA